MQILTAVIVGQLFAFAMTCIMFGLAFHETRGLVSNFNTVQFQVSVFDLMDQVLECQRAERTFLMNQDLAEFDRFLKAAAPMPERVRYVQERTPARHTANVAKIAAWANLRVQQIHQTFAMVNTSGLDAAKAFGDANFLASSKVRLTIRGCLDNIYATATAAFQSYQEHRLSSLGYVMIATISISLLLGTIALVIYERKRRQKTAECAAVKLQEAEASKRLQSVFLTSVSHEIRTPMNGVIALAEELSVSPLSEDQRTMIDLLRTSANSLMRIVDDILLFSKLEAAQFVLTPEVFSLHKFIRETTATVVIRARTKNVQFHVNIAEDAPQYIFADQGRLCQILNNLLDNAIKFTSPNGLVQLGVSTTATDGPCRNDRLHACVSSERKTESPSPFAECKTETTTLYFWVHDSGIGASEDMLQRIFQPFQQALVRPRSDSKTQRETTGSGTGLGLSICAQLVQLMHGQITVRSRINEGTCFSFYIKLPKVIVSGSIGASTAIVPGFATLHILTETVGSPKQQEPRGVRVLMAEDNLLNQKVLSRQLANQIVTVTCTGKEALDAYKAAPTSFDCILMDVHMPEMDGLEATREIRHYEAICKLPRIPIIAITAGVLESEQAECLKSGMDSVVVKPILRDKLFAVLSAVVAHKASRHL